MERYKKTFRFIKRFTYKEYSLFPFKYDCSIVKTSKKHNKSYYLIPEYNIQEADVFNNPETYEIEMEFDNNIVDRNNIGRNQLEYLNRMMRNGITIVLSGLQQTNYPISFTKINKLQSEYLYLINSKNAGKK